MVGLKEHRRRGKKNRQPIGIGGISWGELVDGRKFGDRNIIRYSRTQAVSAGGNEPPSPPSGEEKKMGSPTREGRMNA